jgi:hypothetical protein
MKDRTKINEKTVGACVYTISNHNQKTKTKRHFKNDRFLQSLLRIINDTTLIENDSCDQGRTGHITRWKKSHGAPLVRGPL